MNNNQSFSTLAVHAAEEPDKSTGSIAPILVRSKTFSQKFGIDGEYQYSRGKNPTREQLAEKIAILENGKYATLYASGIAATATFFLSLSPGDHVLCCQEIYGGTYRLIEEMMNKFGITTDYVDFSTEESIIAGIKTNTKYLFVETPTNPSLHIIDLELVASVSKKVNIPFVVDGTFAPPCTTRALDYGASVVIQSLSKYVAGHNDVLAGALITNNKELHEKFWFLFKTVGAILSPDECYRILQNVKTLPMRWERICSTAQKVAEYLSDVLEINKVFYPGLKTHVGHNIAKKQMTTGFGGVMSFELKEQYHNKIKKFVNGVLSDGVIVYAESLASPESILAYPPIMSHKSLPRDVRISLGITDGFFRFSVGFEDPIDIINGLKQGFDALNL